MDYVQTREQNCIRKLREILSDLPQFCGIYFRGIESTTTALTRQGYALDLRTFFNFLTQEIDRFKGRELRSFTLDDLDSLTPLDIELFLEFVGFYTKIDKKLKKAGSVDETEIIGRELINRDKAKARKLSALRSLLKYLHRHGMVNNNLSEMVDTPKLHQKPIIRLEANEVANLLDAVDSGGTLTDKQKQYHEHTKYRDAALLALFLGTGIRISELIGLDTDDFDFDADGLRITRKGGSSVILYFNAEVSKILKGYFVKRTEMKQLPGHEKALFLSLQGKRIATRAVQNLVKKYTSAVTPLKNISPHKLRSTYGTMLYQETGDIYLVADVLGHKDVNTTKRHYAAITDENRRRAAKAVKLRED